MQLSFLQYLILFSSSLICVGVLTPLMRRIAINREIVDRPNEGHKTHVEPTPYLGGVAIVLGVTLISYLALFISGFSLSRVALASSILIPALLVGVMGLIDDIKKLSPLPRFLAQNAIAIVSTLIMISTQTIGTPTDNKIFDFLITIFWIVGLTNALNFFDNIDGGASGTAAISAFFLFVLALLGSQFSIAALSLVLAGGTAGFLIWNKPPARIYMGDAGALFLGLLIASLTVRFDPNPINQIASFSVPFFLLAVPIMDTTVVVLKRIVRGTSPFKGGRDHLSHRLTRAGMSKRQAVVSLWLLTILFGSVSLAISLANFQTEAVISAVGMSIWFLIFIAFLRTRDF
jgi:UDP-GlcNAc:undecaprenyl-phosphate GlcNAc-1-phosphate transferase